MRKIEFYAIIKSPWKRSSLIKGIKGGQIMAGKTDYKNAWLAEKLDRINLTVQKGKKEVIQQYASGLDRSVNAFINQAIEEKIQRIETEEKG